MVYSPNEALKHKVVKDASLQGCLNQALAGMKDGTPAQVTLLACPDAGIKTLEGIGALTSLEQLELSGNGISNLAPLLPLKNLRLLSVRNNRINDIGPLESIATLRFVSLQGNDDIPCRQLDDLQRKLGNTLNKPDSCKR